MLTEPTALERHCAHLRRVGPMEEAEELALARRWIDHRDRSAAKRLIEAHLSLVPRLAHRLRGYGVPKDELISEGHVGLLRAVEKFELRGVRFKTYATYWIRAHMLAHVLRSNSIVTSATGAVGAKLFFKLRSARAKAEALYGAHDEGIDARLAEQFGVSEDVIRHHTTRLSSSDVSLDAPLSAEGDTTGLELLETSLPTPEDAVANLERDEAVHQTLRRVWKGMDARERAVLESRLLSDGDDETLASLSGRFGLSRERLRQIEVRVKDRLRRALDTRGYGHDALLQ